MKYEEKYKEALKVIESLYNVVKYKSSSDALLASQTIEKAFPELKESEDERIRKSLLEHFGTYHSESAITNDVVVEDVLAWLEKQGEQKPSWSEEDERIHTIKVFYPPTGIGIKEAIEKGIEHSKKEGNMLISINGIFLLITQQSTVEKVMEEYNNCVGNNSNIKEKVNPLTQWTTDDESYLKGVICDIECEVLCANCSRNIADIKINWLKSLKYRVQPQPKQEWNKEDERIRQCLIRDQEKALDDVRNDKYGHSEIISDLKEIYRERIDWLKSLKPYHWKPSEQNIKDLEWCADLVKDKMGVGFNRLQVFIDELKQL